MTRACHKTCKGRVVYDRKMHAFRIRDLVRIGKKIPEVLTVSASETDMRFFEDMAHGRINLADFIGFSGGEFGGAGATRDIGDYVASMGSTQYNGSKVIQFVLDTEL